MLPRVLCAKWHLCFWLLLALSLGHAIQCTVTLTLATMSAAPPSRHGASVSLIHSTDNAREDNHHLPGTSQTFKIQFLLKLLVQLLTVELGVCTLKIKVAFELDGILLDVSWAALPPGAIPGSSIP